jgi:predicted transcriptional regulator
MRKLIFAINITLDGCCDHTKQFVADGRFRQIQDAESKVTSKGVIL